MFFQPIKIVKDLRIIVQNKMMLLYILHENILPNLYKSTFDKNETNWMSYICLNYIINKQAKKAHTIFKEQPVFCGKTQWCYPI